MRIEDLRCIDSERAVIGWLLAGPAEPWLATDVLTASDFSGLRATVYQLLAAHPGMALPEVAARTDVPGPLLVEALADGAVTSQIPRLVERLVGLSTRRQTLTAADTISNAALDEHLDPAGVVDTAQRVTAELALPIGDATPDPTVDEFLAETDDTPDWLIPGILERRDRCLITAGEGQGKALAADTPIPTPDGWVTMGDLEPGDVVFGSDGRPTPVTAVSPVFMGDCFAVTFDEGTRIVADGDHQWFTFSLAAREAEAQLRRRHPTKPRGTDQRWKRRAFPGLVSTRVMAATLWARGGHALNHAIPVTAPLDPAPVDLPISPYTLGAWLGDGTSRTAHITTPDVQVVDEIRSEGWDVRPTSTPLRWRISGGRMRDGFESRGRKLGVWGDKHIPDVYKRASASQRLALLQGLVDTDGYVGPDARVELTFMNARLSRDVHELVVSLGHKASIRESDAKLNGRVVGRRWRISFHTDLPLARLQRKAERLTPRPTRRHAHRYVTAVEPVPAQPVRCIQVAAPNGLFLASTSCVATHNSTLLRQVAVCTAAGVHPFTHQTMTPRNVLIVDLENHDRQVRRKLRPLRVAVRDRLDPARLRIAVRPSGLDLCRRADATWLTERVAANRTELLVVGPLYRMHTAAARGDVGGEDQARTITAVLDRIRHRFDVTLLVETHAPHAQAGHRDLRPFGSSVWLRWPEYGLGLRRDATDPTRWLVVHWRGPRDERDWPSALTRGGLFPWTAHYERRDP